MTDEYQIVIPLSFIALFIEPGRSKPNARREIIAGRYEFCEDLANSLTEPAKTTYWEFGITTDEILERIFRGVCTDASEVTATEARWITRRLAELLDWGCPAFDGSSD